MARHLIAWCRCYVQSAALTYPLFSSSRSARPAAGEAALGPLAFRVRDSPAALWSSCSCSWSPAAVAAASDGGAKKQADRCSARRATRTRATTLRRSASRSSRPRTRRVWRAPTRSPTPRASRGRLSRRTDESSPKAVVIVDQGDWRAAISAAQLMARPLRAPILLLRRRQPAGRRAPTALRGAGALGRPAGRRRAGDPDRQRRRQARQQAHEEVPGASSASLAQAIDKLQAKAAGEPTQAVLVAPADNPEFAMPAAGWAAKLGRPRPVDAQGRAPGGDARGHSVAPARADLRARPARRRSPTASSTSSPSSARRSGSPAPTRSRTRSRSRATPTGASAGASSTRATGSCSRTCRGRSTRPPARRAPAPAHTGRCCC